MPPLSKSNRAFSLIELLTVLAIMSLLFGLVVSTGFGTRPAGARQGAISQLMTSLEEARLAAIEKGSPVRFGIAGSDHPDEEKRYRAFILFREQSASEEPDPAKRMVVALSRWQTLPQGFYFDPDKLSTVTVRADSDGLPGAPAELDVLEFGSLGQLQSAVVEPLLAVTEAVFDPVTNTILRKGDKRDISIRIYRLTGRLALVQ